MPVKKLIPEAELDAGPGELCSSGLHTIIKIGNSDIHELTKSALEIELGVGGFGGSGSVVAGMAAPLGSGGLSSLSCLYLSPPQRPKRLANQRIVRCWRSVAVPQTRTKKPHWRKWLLGIVDEGGFGRDSIWIIVR